MHNHKLPSPVIILSINKLINTVECNNLLKHKLSLCLDHIAKEKNISINEIQEIKSKNLKKEKTTHALIEIYPINDSDQYRHLCNVNISLYPSHDISSFEPRTSSNPLNIKDHNSITLFINELIEALPEDQRFIALEFFLPISLFTLDIGKWTGKNGQIKDNYSFVIRSWDRIYNDKVYKIFWSEIDKTEKKFKECTQCINSFDEYTQINARQQKYFALTFTPNKEHFERMLMDGVSVLLWGDNYKQNEIKKLNNICFSFLPNELFKLRLSSKMPTVRSKILKLINKKIESNCPNNLVLLWDDKNRVPSNYPELFIGDD